MSKSEWVGTQFYNKTKSLQHHNLSVINKIRNGLVPVYMYGMLIRHDCREINNGAMNDKAEEKAEV
jgi:hypothetical protein